MRAILIDPFKQTVEYIDIDPSLDNLYEVLGVDLITVLRWSPGHALILDDEGFLKDHATMEYWRATGFKQPFAGRGLILGDEYGENRPASVSLEVVKDCVSFVPKEEVNPSDWTGWQIIAF
jgi:hypothetical protein